MNAPTSRFDLSLPRQAARAALQWRLLLLWAGVLLLPTAVMALPIWQVLGENLDFSAHVGELAERIDATAVSDLLGALNRNGTAISAAAKVALGLTLLLSPLMSGMVVTAARAPQPAGLHALLAGALQEYPRMLRMLLWSVVPLGLAALLGSVAIQAAHAYARDALLESQAVAAYWAAAVFAAALVLVAHASIDAGRAEFGIDRRRRSAVKAWWAGVRLIKRRALALLSVYLGVTVVGLLLAAVLGVARLNLPHAHAIGIAAAFALTQLIALALAWMRCTRLFALIALARR